MALKQTRYSTLLLIKDGSATLSFSSVHSLHCRYEDEQCLWCYWVQKTDNWCLILSVS